MIIADTHADTLLRLAFADASGKLNLDITAEKMKAGGVSLQVLAFFSGSPGMIGDAYKNAMLEYAQLAPNFLDRGIKQIKNARDVRDGECGVMLSVEGGEIFQNDLGKLDEFYELGVRMVGLTWNTPNGIACSAVNDDNSKLTAYGRRLLKKINALGIMPDMSHINTAGFWDCADISAQPIMASHSCCAALCDHPRNLSDEQIKHIISQKGYIGVNYYPKFLTGGRASSYDVARHIAHILDLGGEDVVGLGSDFDGIDEKPEDMQDCTAHGILFERMKEIGAGEGLVKKIAGGNFIDYFARVCG